MHGCIPWSDDGLSDDRSDAPAGSQADPMGALELLKGRAVDWMRDFMAAGAVVGATDGDGPGHSTFFQSSYLV